jgi:uncharacterized damage-inducible protein DinB
MKSKNSISLVAIIFLAAFSLFITSTKESSFKAYDWLKPRLEASKAYTIAVLEAMPSDDYDFKASEDQRSFAAQAYHIAYSIDYFERAFANGGNAAWQPGDENSKSKEELIQWASEKFDAMNEWILSQPANDQLTAGIISYLDHNAHHRGQMVTYLRLKGITPPNYQ